jgi:hypothetical protein
MPHPVRGGVTFQHAQQRPLGRKLPYVRSHSLSRVDSFFSQHPLFSLTHGKKNLAHWWGRRLQSTRGDFRTEPGYCATRRIVCYQTVFNQPSWSHKYVQVRNWGEEKGAEKGR